MKMITKVLLVIAILLLCVIIWSLFLGNGGILELGWNGVRDMVNSTWTAITGSSEELIQEWKQDTDDVDTGITDLDNANP